MTNEVTFWCAVCGDVYVDLPGELSFAELRTVLQPLGWAHVELENGAGLHKHCWVCPACAVCPDCGEVHAAPKLIIN